MKRFAFRLQPLLNYKNYKERLAQQETAQAHMDVVDCEKMIEDLKRRLIASARQMDRMVSHGISAASFRQYQDFLNGMEDTIAFENNRKISLEKILEEKRLQLKKKSIEKKTMERLREKQADAYAREALQAEQKDMDEICALKSAREINNESV